VVLDGPDAVEADLLRVDGLLHAVADRLVLDVGRPVLDLGLEDHRELHASLLLSSALASRGVWTWRAG
jgi:hypothetical protein